MSIVDNFKAQETKFAQRKYDKHLAKLTKKQGHSLHPGETFKHSVQAYRPTMSQPSSFWVSGIGGLVGAGIGKAIDRPKAQRRAEELRAWMGRSFDNFPESKNGYTVATTELRVLIFDWNAKALLSEGSLNDMTAQIFEHAKGGLTSIVFSDATDAVAVTLFRYPLVRDLEGFVESFATQRCRTL